MKTIKRINISHITEKLTKDQMKKVMAGSLGCVGSSCPGGYCSGSCNCNTQTCV